MKNILCSLLFIASFFLLEACKTDKVQEEVKTEKAESKPKEVTEISAMNKIKNMLKIDDWLVKNMNEDAEFIINHRHKETDKKSWIMLDKDLWEYEFIFTGKEMTKPGELAGHWIDFNEDLTYTYGYFEDVTGGGRYAFDMNTSLLLLIDNDTSIKPQEFETKLLDQLLIMDGNEIYRDNNYNAKLRRLQNRPVK